MGKEDKESLEAFLEGYVSERRRRRFREVLESRTQMLTVALEDVYHVHNTSAAIRSCDAFGIQNVHLMEQRFGDRIDKKIARGSEKWIDLHRYPDAAQCLSTLKLQGYEIVATALDKGATALPDFKLMGPTAIFFGMEKEGLSGEILNAADRRLYIPMEGFAESFNVSVAVALVLSRLKERLRESGLDWQIPMETRERLYRKWVRNSVRNLEALEKWYLGSDNS